MHGLYNTREVIHMTIESTEELIEDIKTILGIRPNIDQIREKHETELISIEGVSGVTTDVSTGEIVVMLETPDVKTKIPFNIEGYNVRTEVVGRLKARSSILEAQQSTEALATYSRTSANIPIFGGISVGNPYITAGTLGIVTRDNRILSCAHVLAMDMNANFLRVGTPTYQPGVYDGGHINTIGYTHPSISTVTLSAMQMQRYRIS